MKNFYNVAEGQIVNDGASSLTDWQIWETSTLKLGWEVAGVYPAGYDGTDINGVDADEMRELLVSGDDFGSIQIYKFPVTKNNHQCLRMTGHSQHVPRVKFMTLDGTKYIVSIGGYDRTLIQWKQTSA
mmetsp:Transcript_14405/g.24549  ORF Transcript_14405/g.24549 Transcript_14405/m.24549 type:complete len:128 (-) Transcript_14405:59-442(-)